jgi:hypothetical protein
MLLEMGHRKGRSTGKRWRSRERGIVASIMGLIVGGCIWRRQGMESGGFTLINKELRSGAHGDTEKRQKSSFHRTGGNHRAGSQGPLLWRRWRRKVEVETG